MVETNRKLLDLAAGRISRLMVIMPPRHGKSELISKTLPAWILGRFPHSRVMLVSYGHDFASEWGGKARYILDTFGPETFGVRVGGDVVARDNWSVEQFDGARWMRTGGGMNTLGAGGSITGRGADWLIIDDPIKNNQEAESLGHRNRMWEWYLATVQTRLNRRDSPIILVQTRWHYDDLAGRLLEAQAEGHGEEWEVLHLPAIADSEDDAIGRAPGEALWPDRFPVEALEQLRRMMGSYWFSSLYQGSPIPREGRMFKREWFEVWEQAPADLWPLVRYWDLASTEQRGDNDPDYSVGCLYGYSKSRKMWVVADVVRFRGSPGHVESIVRSTAMNDGRQVPVYIEQEPGSSGKSLIWHYQRNVLPAHGVRAHGVGGSKEVRAMPIAATAESGAIALVRGNWVRDWLEEVEQFPRGPHDDQVDAWSGAHDVAARMLDQGELVAPFGVERTSPWRRGSV